MELYSILLLAAISFTSGSLLVTVGSSNRRVAGALAALAAGAALAALVVHIGADHPAGSERALVPLAFAGEHPTLVGVLLTATGLLFVWFVKNREKAGALPVGAVFGVNFFILFIKVC